MKRWPMALSRGQCPKCSSPTTATAVSSASTSIATGLLLHNCGALSRWQLLHELEPLVEFRSTQPCDCIPTFSARITFAQYDVAAPSQSVATHRDILVPCL